MAIYKLQSKEIAELDETSFEAESILERRDLQRLLREKIDIISPETLIISEEFGEWEGSKRRIDLLGIDKQARLVVIELKRTETGAHMELQAIRYAAMLSNATFDNVVEIYTRFLENFLSNEINARESLLDFLGWNEPYEDLFASDVRIVLASAEFSKELTTTVMWLNQRELDIRCVKLKLYKLKDDGQLFIEVQQVIPIPEAADYQIGLRQKSELSKEAKMSAISNRDYTKYNFNNETYGKGRLVLAVITEFIKQNPAITFEQLKIQFPDKLQGSLGVIEETSFLDDNKSKSNRFFTKPNEILTLQNENKSVIVCSDWGLNTKGFVEYARERFGFEIEEV